MEEYDSYEFAITYYDGTEETIYGDSELRSTTTSYLNMVHSLSNGYILGESDGTYFSTAGYLDDEGLKIVCENSLISENTINESLDEYTISGDTHILTTFLTGDEAKEEEEWWGNNNNF